MHSPLLQLEDYGLTDLSIRWEQSGQEATEAKPSMAINYQVARQTDNPQRYKLTLNFRHTIGSKEVKNHLSIQTSIVGFFLFPEDMTVPEREKAIRVNGLTILYGTLRGLLLPITAAFPPGSRFVLPAIDMMRVIKAEEELRATSSATHERPSGYRLKRKKANPVPSSKATKP